MTMVDKESIIERLQALEEYANELRSLRQIPLMEVKADTRTRWAIERGLLLAIECVLDIGSHIVAEGNLGRPKDYTEIIDILSAQHVIPTEFGQDIRKMPGFRNLLIHEYIEVDVERVYENLQSAPEQFDLFRSYVGKFLELQ